MQQRAEVIEETGDPFEDAGNYKPAVLREATLSEQFELELKSFLSNVNFDGMTFPEELVIFLWDKFAKDIRFFGKNISHFETCSKELQHEIMEWFFSKLLDDIQELDISEGRSWKNAVSLYFEKLRRRNSLADAAIWPRHRYLGADK